MSELSHTQLWSKLKQIRGIEHLLRKALLLHALMSDADVPRSSKIIAVTALVYLVNPFDAIPDVTPFLGYVDDLAVIMGALKKLSKDIQPHHEAQAQQMLERL
ncbi:DUF1232 domain-containing protein [Proteobacteria bacterium 005FR1]|nr:DUF1232 domain-containing protein [Proteobacteria bacterium 005FR1]